MTNYHSCSISLSEPQKKSLINGIKTKQPVTFRLKNSQLVGNDEMMLTKTQINKIKNTITQKKVWI